MKYKVMAGVLAMALSTTAASAITLEISITNNQESDGLFLTPLYTAFHNGSFDAFDVGGFASDGLELIAEEGAPAPGALPDAVDPADFTTIQQERLLAAPSSQGAPIFGPEGFGSAEGQPPVIDAGETATIQLHVDTENRYFTFISMVIPSNDFFIGNDDPTAFEIFDEEGNFVFDEIIEVTLGDVYDAGTEINDQGEGGGAAFNPIGGGFGAGAEENLAIALADISSLFGSPSPVGPRAGAGFFEAYDDDGDKPAFPFNDSLASISISVVPVPAGLPLALSGIAAFGFFRRQQKRKAQA